MKEKHTQRNVKLTQQTKIIASTQNSNSWRTNWLFWFKEWAASALLSKIIWINFKKKTNQPGEFDDERTPARRSTSNSLGRKMSRSQHFRRLGEVCFISPLEAQYFGLLSINRNQRTFGKTFTVLPNLNKKGLFIYDVWKKGVGGFWINTFLILHSCVFCGSNNFMIQCWWI